MNKESKYKLQKIDCNCNDCIFLDRDLNEFNKWKNFQSRIARKEFDRRKKLGLIRANAQFQFDKSNLLHYGSCKKLNKRLSFIPNILQLDTQLCFKHRKDK